MAIKGLPVLRGLSIGLLFFASAELSSGQEPDLTLEADPQRIGIEDNLVVTVSLTGMARGIGEERGLLEENEIGIASECLEVFAPFCLTGLVHIPVEQADTGCVQLTARRVCCKHVTARADFGRKLQSRCCLVHDRPVRACRYMQQHSGNQ